MARDSGILGFLFYIADANFDASRTYAQSDGNHSQLFGQEANISGAAVHTTAGSTQVGGEKSQMYQIRNNISK